MIGVSNESVPHEGKADEEFPIAGIGASAGGLDPIRKLLEHMPINTGLSFVVIQHLAANQESMLPEILSRSTQMKVVQVIDNMKVEKNRVYVIPPGTTMMLKNGFLRLVPKEVATKPINVFFSSLALELKAQAIGVLLSGTGNDGTEGLKAIKAEDGITFAQDPKTAQYADMPQNAINAQAVYFVLSPEQIAEELISIAKHPQLIHAKAKTQEAEQAKSETDLKKILMMLKTAFGVDFTHYKDTTINRRITRRMVISKAENMKVYVEFLRATPNELQALFDDMLIGVTSFFREPKTFEVLKEKVLPELVTNRPTNYIMRIWVPGCSTGEEVYSLAIVIQEFLEENAIVDMQVQVFGTDANEKSIEKARQGIFSKVLEDDVSENRLKQFFNRSNGNYQITKPIRDMCIFAKHDITVDPPFSNLDLVMCRNLLIYFDSHLHERVLPMFHYGLKPEGFLVLGESESIGKFQYLFDPITTKGVIFKRKRAQPQANLGTETLFPYTVKKSFKPPQKTDTIGLMKQEVDQLLIEQYVPATILANNNLDILFFRGQVNPYLTHEAGTASLNITKIIRKDLRPAVQTALYRARKENKLFIENVEIKQDRQQKTIKIRVNPIKLSEFEELFYLITFEEVCQAYLLPEMAVATTHAVAESLKDRQISELKEDLESTKQSLQTIVEAHEATNEELRSAMEEAQSSNEALQSTNEELETAKEELQSSNEELQTLNEELKNRNQALSQINDDLVNLNTNIDAIIVIVDNNFRIRRFSTPAQEILKIAPSDVGRALTDLRLGIQVKDLEKILQNVTSNLSFVRQEVADGKGHFYEMRTRPYLTAEKKIDGAVLSFVDVTERKLLENERNRHTVDLERQVREQASKIVQSERMSAIGETAGMVGHDIRNPLQAIASDVYLAKTDLDSMSEGEAKEGMKESLGSIEKNVDYINKIVQDLQDFVRPLTPTVQETDLEALCQEVMFKSGVPENIDASCQIDKEAKKLIADPAMLRRMLSNLVNNAVQALPQGGKLVIHAFKDAGDVVINVQDTGVGIPEALKPKLFTPLFTTKSKGQGFGLAVIKRMTEALGGTVTYESEAGKGTKFTIRLPPKELNGK